MNPADIPPALILTATATLGLWITLRWSWKRITNAAARHIEKLTAEAIAQPLYAPFDPVERELRQMILDDTTHE